jgi:5-methylcytosine-specific restriction endonuclease McrBC GTP-binding regulatory subunit McrB
VTRNRKSNTRFVQFHPTYSYESFVEGLRPVTKNDVVSFELTAGVVIDHVALMRREGALNQAGNEYVIIIDEANRANLPKVLGEMMFLFEYRNETIQLQYSPEFQLPTNLRFIATMNTADRSIRSIDIALRRRFDVFELPPSAEILERHYRDRLTISGLAAGFDSLNEALTQHLDRHHTIGHAFFMREHLDANVLRRIWERRVYPLIEEFFFDQPDIAREFSVERFWPSINA